MSPPRPSRVFLSYCHESDEHVDRVKRFYELLRASGVDAKGDFPAQERPQNWARWMLQELQPADRILVIASPEYRRQTEGRGTSSTGFGIRREFEIIRTLADDDADGGVWRILVVLLPGVDLADVPTELGRHHRTHYRVDPLTPVGAERLLRALTDQPGYEEPPLGPEASLPPRVAAPTVALRLVVESEAGHRDDPARQRLAAAACERAGLTALDLGLDPAATRGDIPVSPGHRPLDRWLRALDDELAGLRGAFRARVGLAVNPPDADAVDLADELASGETARALHETLGGPLVVAVSEAVHKLAADRVLRFPAAKAYRSATADRGGGSPCRVAVAAQSVCPEVPPPAGNTVTEQARRERDGSHSTDGIYNVTVYGGKRVHVGPRYRDGRRRG